jgi:hypothetical protein
MKTTSDSDLAGLAQEMRDVFQHMHNVAKTMFIMRDQNGGDERVEGALDLLANKLEDLVGEVEETFEKIVQANRQSVEHITQ